MIFGKAFNVKLAIMQPYFMPYIGYFQLINAVDKFIVYDNIKYTKKGWINRNRILNGNGYTYLTLPLEKDSDFRNIDERLISTSFNKEKFLNQIKGIYNNAPWFENTYQLINQVINYDSKNLFEFIFNSIKTVCEFLEIDTLKKKSSFVDIDHSIKGKEKVLQICKTEGSITYINAIGGIKLYDEAEFIEHGINLKFLQTNDIRYQQFIEEFVPSLSIIDVLMFNSREKVIDMLNQYELI